MVDSAEQIIVAAETTNEANDKQQAVPMAQAALDNLNAAGIEQPKAVDGCRRPNTADTGYFSKEAVEELEKSASTVHIATGREAPRSHRFCPRQQPLAEGGRPRPSQCEGKRCSANCVRRLVKLSTRWRKHIVEPVFGMIKSARGIRKFLLRGLEKVSAEWQLICLTHNLLKIWRRSCSVGVD